MTSKNTRTRLHTLFSTALFGVGAAITFSSLAVAVPRNDVKDARRDVKEARKDVKQEKKEVRKADSPRERQEARQDLRQAERDLRREKQDLKQEKREEKRDDRRDDWRDNRRYNYQRNDYRTFTGTVADVGNGKFDLRVGNIRLNVLSNSGLPRGLNRGDIVRVYGVRDQNRIINANVNIINNR